MRNCCIPSATSQGDDSMKSLVMKRSIALAGHKTSVSLEDPFWHALQEIADGRRMRLSDLVSEINVGRQHGNLSCALRLFVLGFYRDQIPELSHRMKLVSSSPLVRRSALDGQRSRS